MVTAASLGRIRGDNPVDRDFLFSTLVIGANTESLLICSDNPVDRDFLFSTVKERFLTIRKVIRDSM